MSIKQKSKYLRDVTVTVSTMRIYLAGPLFNAAETEYNRLVKRELEARGMEVVLPQDSDILFEPSEMDDRGYALDAAEKIFERDLQLLDSCDALVINLDGRVPDEGACVELGYAFAKGKPVFGLKTDVRVSEFGIDNMMIAGMLRGRTAGSVSLLAEMLNDIV